MSIDLRSVAAPDPTSGEAGVRTRSEPARQAWQREMEQAQTQDWFRKAAQSSSPRPPHGMERTHVPSTPSAMRPLQVSVALPHPVLPWRVASAQPGVSGPPAASFGGEVADTARVSNRSMQPHSFFGAGQPAEAPLAGGQSVPVVRQGLTSTVPAGATHATLLPFAGAATPLRVHLQWDGDTAHVWVGADASHVAHLPQVAAAVTRWLAGQGIRVAQLTCNGASWPTDAPPQSLAAHALADVHITSIEDITREF